MRFKLLIVAGALITAIGWTVSASFSLPVEVAARLRARMREQGLPLQFKKSRFSVLRGIQASAVEFQASSQADGGLSFSVQRIGLAHQVRAALDGVFEITRVEMDGVSLQMAASTPETKQPPSRSTGEKHLSFPDAQEQALPTLSLRWNVATVVVRGGSVSFSGAATQTRRFWMEIDELLLHHPVLTPGGGPLLARIFAHGRVRARSLQFGVYKTRDAEGEVEWADGHIMLRDLVFLCRTRTFRLGEIQVDLVTHPGEYSISPCRPAPGQPVSSAECAPGEFVAEQILRQDCS